MNRTVEFFDWYTNDYGWKIIPVYPRSKIPVGLGWNGRYNPARSRHYITHHPNTNLGVLLGEFIDVEGDTPEANELLGKLVADHAHPMYESNKSIHHLFACPDPDLTALKCNGIEFRGHKHYSVIPPSLHAGGVPYKWLTEPDGVIPAMPDTLLEFYEQHRKKQVVKNGFVAAECSCCRRHRPIHRKRYDLEVQAFRHYGLLWQCHECRKVDVRELCRRIRKWSRRSA